MCFALNPRESSFHLETTDVNGVSSGETVQVNFAELKAVFNVKSFDGKHNKSERFRQWQAEGEELVVQFKDGEVIRGASLHRYSATAPRFYFVPKDTKGNNISILVEATAVERVYTPEEYEAAQSQAVPSEIDPEASADLCQEEVMGDFYFETRNYNAAYEQFALAVKKAPQSARLRGKLLTTEYNIGVQHIKRHEYEQALARMEKVLQSNPNNSHAQKKVLQLRRIIERGAKPRDQRPSVDEF
jgi:tetratricopeptide (TPR) repeat protein